MLAKCKDDHDNVSDDNGNDDDNDDDDNDDDGNGDEKNGNDLDEDDKGSSGLNRGNVCIVQNLKYCRSQVSALSILIFETWPSLLSPLLDQVTMIMTRWQMMVVISVLCKDMHIVHVFGFEYMSVFVFVCVRERESSSFFIPNSCALFFFVLALFCLFSYSGSLLELLSFHYTGVYDSRVQQ